MRKAKATRVRVRRVTTTEGRQRLPDLIQTVYGEKSVIVFHRYGRDLAALVPLDMLPREDQASLNIPKCSQCAAYFPATTGDGCQLPNCPYPATQAEGVERPAHEPPWPAWAAATSKREGWKAFFAGLSRDACPFPQRRQDLQRGYREGWDAAQATQAEGEK